MNEKGFTPVSWRGGTGSVRKVDFGRVIGRRVIVWADNNEVGRKAMDEAAGRCVALGISALHMVDVDKLELPDGGDAADLDAAARLSALEEARAYVVPLAMLPAQPAAQATAPVPKWLKPDYAKLLDDEYDVQNPDSDAARYLRQHGRNTLIVRDIGGQRGGPASVMGLDTETGLWTGTQYVDSAIMRQAQDAHSAVKDGIQPGGVFPRKALTYLGRVVRSSSHRSEAMRSMPTVVYAAMEPFDVVEIPEADMDKVGRYLGAANGVVDLSTARLLPPSEGKLCGVSRSTTVAYRPRARHPYVDSLFKYLDSESAGLPEDGAWPGTLRPPGRRDVGTHRSDEGRQDNTDGSGQGRRRAIVLRDGRRRRSWTRRPLQRREPYRRQAGAVHHAVLRYCRVGERQG